MLQAENLTLTYQDGDRTLNAVDDVSITIEDHQFIGILGPSGSGKSSLLYLLSGLREPTQGEIYLDDRPYGKIPERERTSLRRSEFGFVFQHHLGKDERDRLHNLRRGCVLVIVQCGIA